MLFPIPNCSLEFRILLNSTLDISGTFEGALYKSVNKTDTITWPWVKTVKFKGVLAVKESDRLHFRHSNRPASLKTFVVQ